MLHQEQKKRYEYNKQDITDYIRFYFIEGRKKKKEKSKNVNRRMSCDGVEKHTFALQRRSEVGVIVTITTGGPVAMETGGSGGWGRDKRVHTHTH